MSDRVDRESLKSNHTRRLQKLEEQRALLGYATDPKIDLEIEDIRAQLRALESPDAPDASQSAERAAGGASSQRPAQQDRSTHIAATFNGPVGNVHTGNGDINVNGSPPPPEIVPQWLIGRLRHEVLEQSPPVLVGEAQRRVNSFEDALRRHDADDADDALGWLLRRVPTLASAIQELRRHLSDWRA